MFAFLKRIFFVLAVSIALTSIIVFALGKIETTSLLRPFANFWQVWQNKTSKNQKTASNAADAINNQILSKEVTAHAQVGGYTLNRLAGWTSPYAEVQLNSVALSRKTLADGRGFFAFYTIPVLPNLGEMCLVSQDVNLLPSFPTCLAPPPSNQNIDIIDVLLSPSLSIDASTIAVNATVTASGMTFPNSEVSVYLFSVDDKLSVWFKKISLTKIAYAFSLPKYQTKSNHDGHFEFSLPGSGRSYNRFYVASALNVGGKLGEDRGNKGDMGVMGDTGTKTINNKQPASPAGERGEQKTESDSADAINNELDLLPKTNVAAQAAEDEEPAAELRVSPKSNTLYFRSLGWLEGLFNRLLALIKGPWLSFNNPFSLILVEIVILLSLGVVFVYKKLLNNSEQTYLR